MLKLISSVPSPYARKVRIALIEKSIAFELATEVPWHSTTTQTPRWNPLEKLPVLLVPNALPSALAGPPSRNASGAAAGDDRSSPDAAGSSDADGTLSVFESRFILEYLETRYPDPPLLPADPDLRLAAKQVEVVADGACDALVLRFFERMRDEEKQSQEWVARQMRKIDGALAWLAARVDSAASRNQTTFLVGGSFTVADVAAGSLCGYLDVRFPEHAWRTRHPQLAQYVDGLLTRKSFRETVPKPQKITEKVV